MSTGAAPAVIAETETDFERAGLPPLTDHAFWRMLRVQANTSKPMAQIATELGVDVGDLCDWIMAYTDKPAKRKPYLNKGAGPIGEPRGAGGNGWSPAAQVRRQTAWQRQRDGAVAARKATAE